MFDDLQKQSNQPGQPAGGQPSEAPSSKGAPPPNLPGSEPAKKETGPAPAEDIFASTDTGAAPPPPPAFKPIVPQETGGLTPQELGEFNAGSRRGPVIAIVVIVIIIIAAAAGAGWFFFFKDKPAEIFKGEQIEEPIDEKPVVVEEPIDEEPVVVEEPEEPIIPKDTDQDGLSDQEEEFYGTDPKLVDSDNDQLSDKDEIKVYGTDPRDPDTDNDTYPDGHEVRNGYNPKGAGKLLNLP